LWIKKFQLRYVILNVGTVKRPCSAFILTRTTYVLKKMPYENGAIHSLSHGNIACNAVLPREGYL